MERADKNIDELLENLRGTFHRLRQAGIDEELFDVIARFEALSVEKHRIKLNTVKIIHAHRCLAE